MPPSPRPSVTSQRCTRKFCASSLPAVVPLFSTVCLIGLIALFLWKPPGHVKGWEVVYVLIVVGFASQGIVLGMSDAWRRLLFNRQAVMKAFSSMRAWKRAKQATALTPTGTPVIPTLSPDADTRLCPCYATFTPGVSPISSPSSQRRSYWCAVVIQAIILPVAGYGLMKSGVLPSGALGIGLYTLISAPTSNWVQLQSCTRIHNGNTVLLALMEITCGTVIPVISCLTMALQLQYDAQFSGVTTWKHVVVIVFAVVTPFVCGVFIGSRCIASRDVTAQDYTDDDDDDVDANRTNRQRVITAAFTTLHHCCTFIAVALLIAHDSYTIVQSSDPHASQYHSLTSFAWRSIVPSSLVVSCVITVGTVIIISMFTSLLRLTWPDWRVLCMSLSSRSLLYVIAFTLPLNGVVLSGARGLILLPAFIHMALHSIIVVATSFCVCKAVPYVSGVVTRNNNSSSGGGGGVVLRNPLLNFSLGELWNSPAPNIAATLFSPVATSTSHQLPTTGNTPPNNGVGLEIGVGYGSSTRGGGGSDHYKTALTTAAALARSTTHGVIAQQSESKSTRTVIHSRHTIASPITLSQQPTPTLHTPAQQPIYNSPIGNDSAPQDMSGWTSAIDPRTNLVYYSNRVTGEVTWQQPIGFVETTDWVRLYATNGKPYYYSVSLNKTVWKRPPGFIEPVVNGVVDTIGQSTIPAQSNTLVPANHDRSLSNTVDTTLLEPAPTLTGKLRVTLTTEDDTHDLIRKTSTSSAQDGETEGVESKGNGDATAVEESSLKSPLQQPDEQESEAVSQLMMRARRASVAVTTSGPSTGNNAKERNRTFFAEMKKAKEEEALRKKQEKIAAMTDVERELFEAQEKEAAEREAKKALLLQRTLGAYGSAKRPMNTGGARNTSNKNSGAASGSPIKKSTSMQ